MMVVYGWADNDNRRLATLAAEFVGRQAAVITAPSIAAALAAKSATATIPIVFYTGADPVGLGLVASFNRPNGNLTGVTGLGTELGSKRVELLHELLLPATAVALLVNGSNSALAEPTIRDAQAAARTLGLKLHVQDARTEDEIAVAFVKSVELRAGGLVVGADNFFNAKSGQLAALALRHGLPTIYQYRDFTAAGGLMSYGGKGPWRRHCSTISVGAPSHCSNKPSSRSGSARSPRKLRRKYEGLRVGRRCRFRQ